MTTLEWGEQQLRAIALAQRWLRAPAETRKPYFRLDGFAGTGKSTIALDLIGDVEGYVPFATFTGKAASVLARKGIPNVSTIHKLIYKPKDKSQATLKALEIERAALMKRDPQPLNLLERVNRAIEQEQENLKRPMFALNVDESPLIGAKLLVIDEHSMLDKFMRDDLLSFRVPILLLGDPGQLGPVKGESGFAGEPDFLLTDIHRQAKDSPIIQLATMVREGRVLRPGQYGNCEVIHIRDMRPGELAEWVLEADQLLVGRNATRASSNFRYRQLKGFDQWHPVAGDKLVCLRNNAEAGFLNGTTWMVRQDADIVDSKTVMLYLTDDDGRPVDCLAHSAYFRGESPPHYEIKDAECFDYGGALTVHKSQGSQWDDVLLFDEWNGQGRREWLYTGITRAAKRIRVVQML